MSADDPNREGGGLSEDPQEVPEPPAVGGPDIGRDVPTSSARGGKTQFEEEAEAMGGEAPAGLSGSAELEGSVRGLGMTDRPIAVERPHESGGRWRGLTERVADAWETATRKLGRRKP